MITVIVIHFDAHLVFEREKLVLQITATQRSTATQQFNQSLLVKNHFKTNSINEQLILFCLSINKKIILNINITIVKRPIIDDINK
jgi:hypothetical protein